MLAAAGGSNVVSLIDLANGKVSSLAGHEERAIEAAFSRDGSTLLSVGADGQCIAWDTATSKERFRTERIGTPIRAVSYSPDGAMFATGSDDWKIRLWDAKSAKLIRTLGGVKQHVFGLVFHPKGNILFSCSRDSLVQVWDVRTGRELAVLDGHSDLVLSLSISPDGRTLATCGTDRTVGLWDLGYYQKHLAGNASVWRSPGSPRSSVSVSPQGVNRP